MNFTYLKYFSDSVRAGSLKKAAELNFVTSPAISLGIRKLEEELKVQLIQHTRKKLLLTERGKLLFEMSLDLFRNFDLIKESLLKSPTPHGSITIATQQSLARIFLPKLLKVTQELYPDLELIVKLGTTLKTRQLVHDNQADLAIMINNIDLKGFEKFKIYSGNFVLAGNSKNHQKYYLTEDTKDSIHFQKQYKKIFKKEPHIANRISSWGTLMAIAEEGLGAVYVPDYLLNEIKIKQIYPNNSPLHYPYEIVCISLNKQMETAKAKAFLEACKRVFV